MIAVELLIDENVGGDNPVGAKIRGAQIQLVRDEDVYSINYK